MTTKVVKKLPLPRDYDPKAYSRLADFIISGSSPPRPITGDGLLRFMQERGVKLQPVFGPHGLLHWAAGYVALAADRFQNIVHHRQSATGATPEEALVNLSQIRRRTQVPGTVRPGKDDTTWQKKERAR